ncbi:MAG: trypsin-like peptidase domain-containing protein [Candidatus Pacebacteria bacterium]|nr:trypsin-like peptidase domain-containing protein [Candidatus Paceibacterota bacterium]
MSPIKTQSPIVKIVKKALPSIVSITMTKNLAGLESIFQLSKQAPLPVPKKKKIKVGGGSGFIVSKNGIVLTNRHVVEDLKADYVIVLHNGEKVKPKILGIDPIHDIAILQIHAPSASPRLQQGLGGQAGQFPFLEMGNSSNLDLGEQVIAIGNALGLFKNTVSLGIVSGLSREIQAQSELSDTAAKLRGLIQTDAAINPGNSGGPLIDISGKVIGINAAMVFGAENIGFALPINNAKKALGELKKYGRIRQPFFGIRYLQINKQLKNQFDLPVDFGALVISEPELPLGKSKAVIAGSPAERAGLKESDIIVEISGQKITPEISVNDILGDFRVGQKLICKILRGGKEKIISIILDEKSL